MRDSFVLALSTFFYVGYLPLIPGTFGSIVGLLIFYAVWGNPFGYIFLTLGSIFCGFLVAGRAEELLGSKDPRCIVIDEVCGMLLSLFLIPYDLKLVIIAFFLFRLLDTLKPYPAGRFQGLKGGMGVMADDLVAAIYTNIILHAAIKGASLITS